MLLQTQVRDVYEVIDGNPFGLIRAEFHLNIAEGLATISYIPHPRYRFSVSGAPGAYNIDRAPGESSVSEHVNVARWDSGVLVYFSNWLQLLHRELSVFENEGISKAPDWVEATLPSDAVELRKQISILKKQLGEISKMSELLWQTGTPLNRVVEEFFRRLDYDTQPTASGATYDVTVTLDATARRFLIEVTGIESYIDKGSKKISQVLQVHQTVATHTDRILIVVNAHRTLLPTERKDKITATPEALKLLTGLGATIVTTIQLYAIWEISRTDKSRARRQIEAIYRAAPGLFREETGGVSEAPVER